MKTILISLGIAYYSHCTGTAHGKSGFHYALFADQMPTSIHALLLDRRSRIKAPPLS